MSGINWGDVPTWLAVAVASVGGYAALYQLRQQGNVIKSEAERNKARDELLDRQLSELTDRERARTREQAEGIDVKWDDLTEPPGQSLVVVINGSRRPIRNVSCLIYTDDGPGPGPAPRIGTQYCAPMLPASWTREGWTMPGPAGPGTDETTIRALRPGGRAGFQFATQKADCPGGEADVTFTDDAGFTWSLTSDLALSFIIDL